MALNDIKFIKGNGGLGIEAANEDHISGLIMRLPDFSNEDLSGFESIEGMQIAKLEYFEQLSAKGITKQDLDIESASILDNEAYKTVAANNAIVYHVSEFFRMSPSGTLYLAIVKESGNVKGLDIKNLQYYANGTIRQIAIFTKDLTDIESYQGIVTGTVGEMGLEAEHYPVSLLVTCAGYCDDVITIGQGVPYYHKLAGSVGFSPITTYFLQNNNYIKDGFRNLSLIVGCDLYGDILEQLGHYGYYGCVGTALGAISASKVSESIAWVAKFPLGLMSPGLISGRLINELATYQLNMVNDNRYIFVRKYAGNFNNYFNDNFTLDVPTSDYAHLNTQRTMDKAVRGIYKSLLPWLSANIAVDPSSGKLAPDDVSVLQNVAQSVLEDMQRNGELSGCLVEIDTNQNVLATSCITFVIKQVPVGVVRNMVVNIGFTNKI